MNSTLVATAPSPTPPAHSPSTLRTDGEPSSGDGSTSRPLAEHDSSARRHVPPARFKGTITLKHCLR
jgi:hypothetical protein